MTFLDSLVRVTNTTETANGDAAYKSTLDPVLDFYGMLGASRATTKPAKLDKFIKALGSDPVLAMKALFYGRDIRGGLGEKALLRDLIPTVAEAMVKSNPDHITTLVRLIVEYGSWKDVFELMKVSDHLFRPAVTVIKNQLAKDLTNYQANAAISLLAKWMPSINTSSAATRKQAHVLRLQLKMSDKEYRQTLSKLRKHIDVVERKMSSREWSAIDYAKVPSKAGLLYTKAFSKQDGTRYTQYIQDVKAGKTKINVKTLYPYEIYKDVLSNYQASHDTMWNALPNYAGSNDNFLVMADVSGSMDGQPILISVSLAMYFAERNKGAFKDYFMTFSANPRFVKVEGSDLRFRFASVRNSDRAMEMNTNLEKAFDAVLQAALKAQSPQEDIPKALIVISDMQFDKSSSRNNDPMFIHITKKFEEHGYKLPTIVWWNVNGSANVPITIDDKNTVLVSGASPIVFKSLVEYLNNGNIATPMDMLKHTLNVERYQPVEQLIV